MSSSRVLSSRSTGCCRGSEAGSSNGAEGEEVVAEGLDVAAVNLGAGDRDEDPFRRLLNRADRSSAAVAGFIVSSVGLKEFQYVV